MTLIRCQLLISYYGMSNMILVVNYIKLYVLMVDRIDYTVNCDNKTMLSCGHVTILYQQFLS